MREWLQDLPGLEILSGAAPEIETLSHRPGELGARLETRRREGLLFSEAG